MKHYRALANIHNLRTYDTPSIPDFDELQVQQLDEEDYIVLDTGDRFAFTCCAENDHEAIEKYILHRIPEKLHAWTELPNGDTEPTDEMLSAVHFYTIVATAYSSWEFERG